MSLDFSLLYRQKKAIGPFRIWEEKGPILFLLVVWLIYFAFQMAGTLLLPGFESMATVAYHRLGISASGESHWSWRVTLAVIWSFHVIAFWDFATHRWILHRKYFWIFHEYHHLPKLVMNGMPGISARPFVFFTTLITYLGSVLFLYLPVKIWLNDAEARAFLSLGLPLLAFLLSLVLAIAHSTYLRRFHGVHRVLKFLMITTPQEHVLHHSIIRRCNYGNFTTIWDRVFASYVDPMKIDFANEPLGLPYDQDYLGTLCLGRFKLSPKVRERYRLTNSIGLKR